MRKKLGIVLLVVFVWNLLAISSGSKSLAVCAKKAKVGVLGFESQSCKDIRSRDATVFTVCLTSNNPDGRLDRETFYQLQRAIKTLAMNNDGEGIKALPSGAEIAPVENEEQIITPSSESEEEVKPNGID